MAHPYIDRRLYDAIVRFDQDEVLVNRIGSVVILMPKNDPWAPMMQSLDMFTDDFLADGIEDLPVQERAQL